jgi:hypothetical protein
VRDTQVVQTDDQLTALRAAPTVDAVADLVVFRADRQLRER